MLKNATYYPNKPGARTIAEGTSILAGGEPVSVRIKDGRAEIFAGPQKLYTCDLPEHVTDMKTLGKWVYPLTRPGSFLMKLRRNLRF